MDVKAAGRRVEVQKGSQAAADWTLKWRESVLKSKREAEPRRIVPHKILVNEYSSCYNMQAYFVYTIQVLYIQERLSIYGVPCIQS